MSTETRCAHGLWDNSLCDVCHPEIANPTPAQQSSGVCPRCNDTKLVPSIYRNEAGDVIELPCPERIHWQKHPASSPIFAEPSVCSESARPMQHLVKRMFDECGADKAEEFIRRVNTGEHDIPSPWIWPNSAQPEKPLESERDQKAAIPMRLFRFPGVDHLFVAREDYLRLEAERDQLRMERDAAWNEAIEAAADSCDFHRGVSSSESDRILLSGISKSIRSLARPIPAEPTKEKSNG